MTKKEIQTWAEYFARLEQRLQKRYRPQLENPPRHTVLFKRGPSETILNPLLDFFMEADRDTRVISWEEARALFARGEIKTQKLKKYTRDEWDQTLENHNHVRRIAAQGDWMRPEYWRYSGQQELIHGGRISRATHPLWVSSRGQWVLWEDCYA